MNMKATREKVIQRTNGIVVGHTYWLSSFYDKDGTYVKVLGVSIKTNSAGWPSSVSYEIIEPVGELAKYEWQQPGKIGTCNATNLYENRGDSSHTKRFSRETRKGSER
jgi:hypothetical protein